MALPPRTLPASRDQFGCSPTGSNSPAPGPRQDGSGYVREIIEAYERLEPVLASRVSFARRSISGPQAMIVMENDVAMAPTPASAKPFPQAPAYSRPSRPEPPPAHLKPLLEPLCGPQIKSTAEPAPAVRPDSPGARRASVARVSGADALAADITQTASEIAALKRGQATWSREETRTLDRKLCDAVNAAELRIRCLEEGGRLDKGVAERWVASMHDCLRRAKRTRADRIFSALRAVMPRASGKTPLMDALGYSRFLARAESRHLLYCLASDIANTDDAASVALAINARTDAF